MRVSVTIDDELNEVFAELAKENNMSKDKTIGSILMNWKNNKELVGRLEDEVEGLKVAVHELICERDRLNQELISKQIKKHNERGAGRVAKFGEVEKEMMKMYKLQGKTYRQIAEIYSCSPALVCKLINEQ